MNLEELNKKKFFEVVFKMDTFIIPDVVPVVLQHLDIPDLIAYSKANKSCNEYAEEAWKLKLKNEVSLPVFRKYVKRVDEGKKWVTLYVEHRTICFEKRLAFIIKTTGDLEMGKVKWVKLMFDNIASNWWLVRNHSRYNKFQIAVANKINEFKEVSFYHNNYSPELWEKYKWMYDEIFLARIMGKI
jgi:hypothetical protein